MEKSELKKQIIDLKELIKQKQEEIESFEIDPDNYEDDYCAMLDETNPELFNLQPSRILKECDPIAYRCGLIDYVDTVDLEDLEEYQTLESELEDLQEELEDLESELEYLEEEA